MKYLFITLAVQDGERRHDHRILHTTNAQNINFAAQKYAAEFWGYGERYSKEDDYWWVDGEITIRLTSVIEISKYEYDLMSGIFNGRTDSDNYFKIVQAGFEAGLQREEVEINCGKNGKLMIYQDADKLGFIVDAYGQNDEAGTMTVWEEDLIGDSEEDVIDKDDDGNCLYCGQKCWEDGGEMCDEQQAGGFNNDVPTKEEIKAYLKEWGQKQGEITSNLGYPKSHSESDELLMEDYFFLEGRKEWYPKISRMYSEREQFIADYVRNNRDNY